MYPRRKIKPASPDLVVRDPRTMRRMPDEGEEKNITPFWIRRLRDGDVVYADEPPEKPKGRAKGKAKDKE